MKIYKVILLVLIAGTFVACRNNHAEEHDHGNEHGEVFSQIISYTNELELFAEAKPFVVGEESDILAHFTLLPEFKPLDSASITLSLIVGTQGIRQTVDKPYKPGIYRFSLKPETAGKGRLLVEAKAQAQGKELRMEIPGIIVYSDAHDAIHEAEASQVQDPNGIVFTKEQGWKVDFATSLPQKGGAGQIIKTSARMENLPSEDVTLVAHTNGIVALSGLDALEGRDVIAGQPLMRVSGGGLAENNIMVRFSEASGNYQRAKADYERAQILAADKIVSEKELAQALNEYENARAVYENLKKHFKGDGQVISSPFNGFIKELLVANGDYVEAGTPLLRIGKQGRLLFHADVPQRYYPVMEQIESASIRCPYSGKVYSLEELNGRIVAKGKHANNDNYLLPVHFEANNPGQWATGGFAEVFLKTRNVAQGVFIPNSALMESQGVYYVFVQLSPELFVKREVKTGLSDGINTCIESGLGENERVVIKGAIWVKLAQSSAALDPHAGHVH